MVKAVRNDQNPQTNRDTGPAYLDDGGAESGAPQRFRPSKYSALQSLHEHCSGGFVLFEGDCGIHSHLEPP